MATKDTVAGKENAVDADAIKHYESMSPEEIDAELKQHGIDPLPTIAKVKELVRAAARPNPDPKRSAH